MKRAANRQRGFTLLELLIAITLLGMILVLVFAGLRLGVRSWDSAQASVDSMNTVRAIEGVLRRELTQVYPYRWKKGLPQRLAFQGERYRVSFVAPLPARIDGGGLFAISVDLEQTGREKRIVWKQVPVSSEMEDFSALSDAKENVLAETKGEGKAEEVWLSYFGPQTDGADPTWSDHWDNTKAFPSLIRVQVTLTGGEPWPDFVVAPMLSAELQ